jgi:hypothetical protein
MLRVTEELQLRPALRQVLVWILTPLLLLTTAGVVIAESPVGLAEVLACVVLLSVLADMLALRHVRHRIVGKRREKNQREHVARFDRNGLMLAPVDELGKASHFEWPLLDVLSLPEGLAVTPRRGARVIAFVPERDLGNHARQLVEVLAKSFGGRVLARAHGEPLT